MSVDTLADVVARLRALDKAATPAPWDNDYFYTMANVFRTPNNVGVPVGDCHACGDPDGEIVKKLKTYHVHRKPYTGWYTEGWHQIHNAHGVSVAGNYDYDDGGIIHQGDAALIVAIRNALPLLLDALDPPKRKRAAHQPAHDARRETSPVCQNCGMRHAADDKAACIEGHGAP